MLWGREGYVREGGQGGLCLLGNPTVTGGCLRMAGARTLSSGGAASKALAQYRRRGIGAIR
ncbi:hypothetical protein K250101E9_57030 [Enterocloster aldenensis]